MHCQGGRNPKIAPFAWDFVTLTKEDRATAIGNMHKNLLKIARVIPEISSRTDRQTDTHVDHNTWQPLRGRSKYLQDSRTAFTDFGTRQRGNIASSIEVR